MKEDSKKEKHQKKKKKVNKIKQKNLQKQHLNKKINNTSKIQPQTLFFQKSIYVVFNFSPLTLAIYFL